MAHRTPRQMIENCSYESFCSGEISIYTNKSARTSRSSLIPYSSKSLAFTFHKEKDSIRKKSELSHDPRVVFNLLKLKFVAAGDPASRSHYARFETTLSRFIAAITRAQSSSQRAGQTPFRGRPRSFFISSVK